MMGKLMRAVRYDSYGGGAADLKHVEVPVPTPKKDEVLLKIEAASLNPLDWKIQKGVTRPFFKPPKFPHIPVTDVAGEVVDVGSEIKSFKVGDKVVAILYHNVSAYSGFCLFASFRFLIGLIVLAFQRAADGRLAVEIII
uniref:Quinone oxidoreductase n=1 Tax=Rhizophora mucronata TaxID=61149 RepID=A0A2P2IIL3_RHIMU